MSERTTTGPVGPAAPSLTTGAVPAVRPSPRAGNEVNRLARRLLEGGLQELSAREQRVISTIAGRRHVSQNLNHSVSAGETRGDRIADRVARFGGSWTFILIFVAVLVAWVLLNTVMADRMVRIFDAYPFIFLNLILSMVAALQAPIILMSQNRQAARDRISAGLDYEVNLKAELEIMALHEKLDSLRIDRLQTAINAQGKDIRHLLKIVRRSLVNSGQPPHQWQIYTAPSGKQTSSKVT